jgi:hypothetical protein
MAIISFEYNFIFVKTGKTAGTSIEIELSKRIEDDAIVTPIWPPVKGHKPRNFQRPGGDFLTHMSARRIKEYLGEKTFNRMFKFCFEREPVAKCLSHFHMARNFRYHKLEGYRKTWVEYCDDKDFPIDTGKYSEIKDDVPSKIVDVVFPYEELNSSLRQVTDMLKVTGFKLEATAKSEFSKKRILTIDDVEQRQRDAIYDAFEQSLLVSGLKEYYARRA